MTKEQQRLEISRFHSHTGDPLTDLNVMNEVEKTLTPRQQKVYLAWLRKLCADGRAYLATAAQRAEAFLRTVGRWEGK